MEFKPDFESIIPRMEAFWNNEMLDRACIAVSAPNGKTPREVTAPATIEERWKDQDYFLDANEANMEATWFGGEDFPSLRVNLGPDFFAALLGGIIEYREDTTWVAPFIHDWADAPEFVLDTQHPDYIWHMELYAKAAERAAGRYFVAAPDCHSGGDALVAMRGGCELCLDLFDHPDLLKEVMGKLTTAVIDFHKAWKGPIEAKGQQGHTTSWLKAWSPGYSNATQLDALALISPDQFKEFFRDELAVQNDYLDQNIFHFDGPDAIKHLPLLAEVKGLTHIQWVYGAGNGPMTKWMDLLKEIQGYGIGLHLSCEPREVETLLTELSSKGLYLRTGTKSIEEGEALIKLAEKLSHE